MSYDVKPREIPANGILYYWCVNCGNNGKYSQPRFKNCSCQVCSYDEVTPYDLEEIMESEHLKFRFREVLDANTPIVGS